MEYYSAVKRSEALKQATPWMNLKNIMLGEIIQERKRTNIVWYHLYEVTRTGEVTESEIRLEVNRDWGEEREGRYFLIV